VTNCKPKPLKLPVPVRVEEFVHVDDEISHMRIIDGLVRFCAPSFFRRGVIGKDADNIERVQVAEVTGLKVVKLAAEHHMQELFVVAVIV
jgi:hypothetical protein